MLEQMRGLEVITPVAIASYRTLHELALPENICITLLDGPLIEPIGQGLTSKKVTCLSIRDGVYSSVRLNLQTDDGRIQ
jgi:hypothetical protein